MVFKFGVGLGVDTTAKLSLAMCPDYAEQDQVTDESLELLKAIKQHALNNQENRYEKCV